MINRAIEDLVVARAGTEGWDRVRRLAGLSATTFIDTVVYDDQVTFDLVAAGSIVLDTPPEELLAGFGRHWILFTGQKEWGPLFAIAGDDLRSFVEGLDTLHARIQASMPNCRMPSFAVIDGADGSFQVEYRSERAGLAPMVLGMLEGLATHFDERWSVSYEGRRPGEGIDVFSVDPVMSRDTEGHPVGTP